MVFSSRWWVGRYVDEAAAFFLFLQTIEQHRHPFPDSQLASEIVFFSCFIKTKYLVLTKVIHLSLFNPGKSPPDFWWVDPGPCLNYKGTLRGQIGGRSEPHLTTVPPHHTVVHTSSQDEVPSSSLLSSGVYHGVAFLLARWLGRF